jgi:hypothetical protein
MKNTATESAKENAPASGAAASAINFKPGEHYEGKTDREMWDIVFDSFMVLFKLGGTAGVVKAGHATREEIDTLYASRVTPNIATQLVLRRVLEARRKDGTTTREVASE